MIEPDGWEGDDTRERLWFEQAQEALKADAEAYNRWLEEIDRQGLYRLIDPMESIDG